MPRCLWGMMRRAKSTFGVLAAAVVLGGCAQKPPGEAPQIWLEMARAYQIGTTYDQALIAAREDNSRTLRARLQRLDELDATHISSSLQLERAEDLVQEAIQLDTQAQQTARGNEAAGRILQAESSQRYRAALRWAPEFPSQNPLLLNALGYFLADRGTTSEDFDLSVQLTSRAVALLSKIIERNQDASISGLNQLEQIQQQQALTRDSLAWGLYKMGRFNEAEAAQQKALEQAKSSGLKSEVALAELWWHQAKILQKQGRAAEAESALKEAQRLQPGDSRLRG